MFWIIAVFALSLSALTGYTMVIQGTSLALGRLVFPVSSFPTETGIQDAITPKMQNIRNITAVILYVPLFILTTYSYAWYHAIWVIIVTFLVSTAFPIALGIRAGSDRIISIIITDMEKRKKAYLKSDDELRSNAMGDLINRIKKIPQEEIIEEVKR